MRVAEAAAQVPRRVFVNAGTAWQHVDGEPYRPKGLYAATKQAFEDVLRYYADADQLHVVTLNLYDSYGPDDPRGKLVSALVNAARSGKHLDMTSGRQLIDLVHVDDVVRAFSHAFSLARGMPFCEARAFAVSSGQAVSLRELVGIVEAIVGHPLDVTWGAREDRANEMLTPWYAGDPLPGWSPRIKLVDGLGALLERIGALATTLLPSSGAIALNRRQSEHIGDAAEAIEIAARAFDCVLVAESLRQARGAFDRLTGRAGIEDVLDALFRRFCLGK